MNGVGVSTRVLLPHRFGGEHVFALSMEGDILSMKMEDNARHVKVG